MADAAALREFQLRLAGRLQAARDQPRNAGWLAVECAGLGLLLPLAQAGEIFPAAAVLPVPHTKAWFLGLANLRGDLHGVIDLATFLFLRPAPEARAADDVGRVPPQWVALNAQLRLYAALQVDRLIGLRDGSQLQPVEASAGSEAEPPPAFAAGRWQDEQGRLWQALDLAALAAHPAFLEVAA
jgi:twitching motility protein PilI